VQKTPERLIGDTAYESDQLDAELAQAASNSSRLTAATERAGRRMDARSAGIDADGRWNGCLRGCRTIDGSSCGTSATQRNSWACCTLPAGLSCCGVYELTLCQMPHTADQKCHRYESADAASPNHSRTAWLSVNAALAGDEVVCHANCRTTCGPIVRPGGGCS
jgi:hypothetical protein